jgi:hypothetical protein
MKRIGYILTAFVAILVIFTLALAQLEARNAKYLLRAVSGKDIRGYYGSDALAALAFTGKDPLFAVSAPGEVNGPVRRGKIYFYDNIMADSAVLTIAAPNESELFGARISGGGDFNGDGIPDLCAGAPCGEGTPKDPAGKVYLYLGGADFGTAVYAALSVGEKGDAFGSAVDLTHDINGDGLADLIVGAQHSALSGATSGRAYVWFGRKTGMPGEKPDVEIKLGTTNDNFGCSIASGDVSGDGQPDLIIGARQRNDGDKMPGAVYIFHGGKGVKLTEASQLLYGESTGFQDWFGETVAVVQDQNGDNTADLLVGAPQVTVDGKQVGRVYLYHGAAKLAVKADAVFNGTAEAGRFGQHVYAIGDLNADGKSEWAVQGETESAGRGVIHFFRGGSQQDFYDFTGERSGDRLGNAVAIVTGNDKTGGQKVLVATRWSSAEAQNSGRVYYLSIE